jgi:putative ABC transport system permease protein
LSFKEIFRTAARSLRINPLRSLLSIVGVIFGIASVIALISIGEGVKAQISENIQGLGTNSLEIKSGEPISEEGGASMEQLNQMSNQNLNLSTITLDDLDTVRENEYVEAAYPLTNKMPGEVEYDDKTIKGIMYGTDESYADVAKVDVAYGNFLEGGEGEVVLGSAIAKKLFGDNAEKAVGKKISLLATDKEFEVAGVVAEQEVTFLGTRNLDMYINVADMQDLQKASPEKILSISAEIKDKNKMDEAKESLEEEIEDNHDGEQDFNIQTPKQLMDTYDKIFNILTALVIGVASISLIEGGIGVANIMYVSVKERTKEIGVRLAQGASKKVVIMQFLVESILLCMVGALIGIPLGILAAFLMNTLTPLPATPTVASIFIAFGAAFVTGVIAGVFPARQATKVEITEALRSE